MNKTIESPREIAIELATSCLYLVDSIVITNPLIEIKVSDLEIKQRDRKAIELAILKVNEKLTCSKLSGYYIEYWNNVKNELKKI